MLVSLYSLCFAVYACKACKFVHLFWFSIFLGGAGVVDLANGSFGSGMVRVMLRGKRHFGFVRFRSDELRFGSTLGRLIFGPIRLSCKNKQLCRKFRFGHGLVRVNSDFESTFR